MVRVASTTASAFTFTPASAFTLTPASAPTLAPEFLNISNSIMTSVVRA
jgi:hypothetical protein